MVDYNLKLKELAELQSQRKLTDEEYFMLNRIENYLQALKYNMKYFVYQGGICPGTLDFCKKRDNNVYSIAELIKWKDEIDKPDVENYDPILHLGGNKCFKDATFCNHQLSFITESMAKRLRPDLNVNDSPKQEILLNNSLDPKIISAIEETRSKLFINALPNQKIIIDNLLNRFANDVLGRNSKLMRDNKEITMEEAVEDTARSIIKVLGLTNFKN